MSQPRHPGKPTNEAPVDERLPSCVACGACCFFDDPRYVMVLEDDYERLGDQAERLTHWVGGRSFMRVAQGRCAALRVEASGQYVCSIYERRPQLCREFARGSRLCLGERARKQGRAREALLQVRRGSAS